MGDTKGGPFDIPGDLAREWLRLPANPNGRNNSDVLKPWFNGMDITRRPAGKWIVDFGMATTDKDAALYQEPFRLMRERVRPKWEQQSASGRRDQWFLHHRPRPNMWRALDGLSRYIATPRVAKHRLFVWLDARICPDSAVIAIARQDDTSFRHPAQPLSRSLVAPSRHQLGRPPTLHPDHNLRDFPIPGWPLAGHSRRRLRGRPALRRHRRSRLQASGAARPLAQPARMGGMGRRTGTRLPATPGRPRRSGG